MNLNEIHSDWDDFLTDLIRQRLQEIHGQIRSTGEFTPQEDLILHFMRLPLKEARVLILGQDPYPQIGSATGRAFEVGNLHSWHQPFNNVSLQNIVRAIVKAHTGEIYRFNEIRRLLGTEIRLLPPDLLFKSWENQGVLLLNTAFTCKIDSPGSHSKIWQPFTQRVLRYINSKNPDLIWFLWGNHAIEQTESIPIRHKVFSYHPSRCLNRPNDFLYGAINCFDSEISPVDWMYYLAE